MPPLIDFHITPQPNDTTCGPSCLHSLYHHFGLDLSFEEVVNSITRNPDGGTLAVMLALDALTRGYSATIYTCNLQLFDPTWFGPNAPDMRQRLDAQRRAHRGHKMRLACAAYVNYLDLGGKLFMEDLRPELLADLLRPRTPIIVGLSQTWLYRSMRERPENCQDDDVAGEPVGHFVVLRGISDDLTRVSIADPTPKPMPGNPAGSHYYEVDIWRLIGAILLGIVTYDAKLLILTPPPTIGA